MMPQQQMPFAQNNNSQAAQYNPDVFEYDDELPEGEFGERVILSDDPIPREIGVVKTIGTKKKNFNVDPEELFDWNEEDDDDDARIEEFLQSQM